MDRFDNVKQFFSNLRSVALVFGPSKSKLWFNEILWLAMTESRFTYPTIPTFRGGRVNNTRQQYLFLTCQQYTLLTRNFVCITYVQFRQCRLLAYCTIKHK